MSTFWRVFGICLAGALIGMAGLALVGALVELARRASGGLI